MTNGLYGVRVKGEEYWHLQTLKEWKSPESEKPIHLPPPHVKMGVVHGCDAPENALMGTEMRAILSVLYNRVYQPGYEKESVFPVSFRDPVAVTSHNLSLRRSYISRNINFV